MELIFTSVITYFSGFWGMVELLGTIFSLICVYLAAKHNQWTWFFGAIGVLLFGFLFFEFKLYSDAGLQLLFFLPVQFWGYLKWKELSKDYANSSVVLSLTSPQSLLVIGGVGLLTLLNGYLMVTFTDASFPYADAWTTWMSVFAQILMIKKYWESWVLWVALDVMSVYIYYVKGLYVVSGLYVVFLIMATLGLIKWYIDYQKQKSSVLTQV